MVKAKRQVDTRASIRVVTSNNFLRAAGLENTSLKARKLLYIAMAQSKKTDAGFYEYSISAKEFAALMDTEPQNVYQDADKLTDELMHGFIKYKPDGRNFTKFQLFDKCKYENSILTFKISEDMTPILLELKKDFSQPLLDDFLRMRSSYSIEIWHLMQSKMMSRKPGVADKIEFELTMDELRQVTGTQDKLKQVGQFKERVWNKALKEIYDRTGVNITYTNIKSGRKIIGFLCTATNIIHVDPETIDAETLERINEFKNHRRNLD